MPNAKNQRPTTIDEHHYQCYRALSTAAGRLVSMAALRRAAHNLYLDTWDVRQRVLARYRRQGIYMSEVELVRKLLSAEFYWEELTIVNETQDYSNAG